MIVLSILSILAALMVPNYLDEINQKRAAVTIAETQQILDAARSYRSDKGAWPGNSTCSNAIAVLSSATEKYLSGVGVYNRYSSPYSTSCTSRTFSLDQETVADWDGYLVNSIAGTEIANATTHLVRSTIGIPGSEPALDAKLSRVATGNAELNRMRTTLLLGGNDITEVNRVEAVTGQFSGAVSGATLNVAQNAVVNGQLQSSSASIGQLQAQNAAINGILQAQSAAINGLLQAQGESQFAQKATFNDVVVLNKVVSPNTGCSPNGAIARDSSGNTLSCKSGMWASGSESDFLVVNCVMNNWANCVPVCPSGYTLKSSSGVYGKNSSYFADRYYGVGICTR